VKLGEPSRIGRSLEQLLHDDRRDRRFAGIQQFPQSADCTVSLLRKRSIQTVESTRITGHLLTDRAHVVIRGNYSLANQRENISLLAARDEPSQGEVHSLPLRAGFRQPHDLFDEAVVKHNIRTHLYTSVSVR
jgi:hypothetical protein